jgi:cysteine-rich repeat protein
MWTLRLAAVLLVGAAGNAAAVDVTGVFSTSGLPGVSAVSLRQSGTTLRMCLPGSLGTVRVAEGTVDTGTGAFTLAYVPSALGPGGLGAYCSITITGTAAPDGSTLAATQVEYSTCVPPPFSCTPSCVLSATIPFTATRTSTTPAPCCGDGFLDPGNGEQCDDGNAVAGDCCAPDCTAEPAGGACPQIDLCRAGTCSGFGYCEYVDSCIDQPLYGTRLLLKRVGTRAKLVWIARDPTFDVPGIGGPDDPSLAGATLELFAPFEPGVAMSLPDGGGSPGWIVLGGGTPGYKYRNPLAPLGASAVRAAVLKDGRVLKVVAKEVGFPLDQPLGGVGIRLVTGSLAMCSFFHVGTVVTDQPGRFEARDAGAFFASCDRGVLGTGSPGGAFVD